MNITNRFSRTSSSSKTPTNRKAIEKVWDDLEKPLGLGGVHAKPYKAKTLCRQR